MRTSNLRALQFIFLSPPSSFGKTPQPYRYPLIFKMADVDMVDVGPPASSKGKASVKSSKAGGESSSEGKKRFEVKKVHGPLTGYFAAMKANNYFQWNAVALWAWDIVVDNCAICRNHIMDLCECLFPSRGIVNADKLQVLNVKQIRHRQQVMNVRWRGGSAMYAH
jgi:hypothetical protein